MRPGVCGRPERGCHPQCVCVALGLLCLSGEETVTLWGSSSPVCPVCVCVHAHTGRHLLLLLSVSHVGHTYRLCQPGAGLPVQCSCSPQLSLCPHLRPGPFLLDLSPALSHFSMKSRRAGIHRWTWGEFQGTGTLSLPSVSSLFNPSPSPSRNFVSPGALWMERLGLSLPP